jgi:hypothetical protein
LQGFLALLALRERRSSPRSFLGCHADSVARKKNIRTT